MAGNMADILKRARQGIRALMLSTCDILEYRAVTDQKTHVTRQELVPVYTAQPCKISFSKNPVTAEGEAPAALLAVRLFLPPELDIHPGAVITVTYNGRVQTFKAAGVPAVYTNHQEVDLESADEYA